MKKASLGGENTSSGFVDRKQVVRRFSRVAVNYDHADFFAREIDGRMQERLQYVRLDPSRILDLGCSRGASRAALLARYPEAHWLGLDAALPMLQQSSVASSNWQRWFKLGKLPLPTRLCANAETLPLATGSIGLVWSNLLLHWLDHPLPALAEAHRVLELGGLLMFSTLGPDTLTELRQSFADGYAHTQRFTDMHDLGDMLVECGFADPVMDMERITLTYADLEALLHDLRAAGGSCAMKAGRHGLTGRSRWEAVRASYRKLQQEGRLPATFEVIYGHAWKAAPKQTADGRAIIRFERQRK